MDIVGPVFAAGFDWLEGLLPLLFVIFWIVSQVVNVVRRVAGGGGRPAAPPVRPPRRPVAGEPDGDVRVELERQIEEFLRQSRGEPRQPTPRPASQPAQQRRPEGRPQQRPAGQRSDRSQAAGTSAVRRTPSPLPPKSVTPAPRVAMRQFTPLGEEGDDVAEHVQEAFAHDLAHRDPMLTSPTAAKPAAASSTASELAAAFRDPAALRRLIVMREILDRPIHRWE